MTRGGKVIKWIEKHCKVPEGKFIGVPVKLRPWQKKDIRKIYDNPYRTRRAIISYGKKNGKTAFAAFLLLCHLAGVEAVQNTQLYSGAMSREQAATLYELALKIVKLSASLSEYIGYRDSKKELYCKELGTVYKALSSEAKTAHGKSPIFFVHDELGQVIGPTSDLYTALESAAGAHENPLSITISTQARTDGDLLSILIDDALLGRDKRTTISLYTADEDIDPFSVKAMRQANPAYGDFLNATEVKDQAFQAKRIISLEPAYRNLNLNQRVEMKSPWIPKTLWQGCIGEVMDSFAGYPVYCGLDLSAVNDLTALSLVAVVDDKYQSKAVFWLPESNIIEKSRADRVPYDQWSDMGHLMLSPGASIEYDYVADYLRGLFDTLDIQCVAFDRWNWRFFKPALIRAGFTEEELENKFMEFGQGFKSMSPAMRDADSIILQKKFIHDNNPVMNMCISNSRVDTDPTGARKLTKQKSSGRIDGAVALVMAMSVAATHEVEEEKVSFWENVS